MPEVKLAAQPGSSSVARNIRGVKQCNAVMLLSAWGAVTSWQFKPPASIPIGLKEVARGLVVLDAESHAL
jgi:hypothetical protein